MEKTPVVTTSEEPKKYDDKIIACFKHLCSKQSDGASPAEVAEEMAKRGWLVLSDTVLDIEKIMRRLRYAEGRI